MEKFARAGTVALTLWFAGHALAAHADAPAPDADAITRAVMEDQYGKQYDAKHACWTFEHTTEQGDALTYCMRPGKPKLVDGPKGKQLYIYAANAYDIKDDNRYTYSQAQQGLMGAFKVQVDANGHWTYQAIDNAMEYGTGGYCGCNKAAFVKLSRQGDYGWLFTSGGSWQGPVVADYSLVMARKGEFVDVSKIPRVKASAKDIVYDVKVANAGAAAGMFPLDVTKSRGGAVVASFKVAFDPKSFAYALPAGQ